MKKHVFYTEVAYIAGILLLALGTAMTEFGNFGISMVVAPAYILHLKISEIFSFYSFGMAEYTLQAVILLTMMLLLRRVRLTYFFSLVTAVIYGFVLDMAIALISFYPYNDLMSRIVMYVLGVLLCGAGISFLFHTYLPPEVYEMFVKEVSARLHMKLYVFKIIYDVCSCVLAIVMALAFFGELRGIGMGTILCTFINGLLIRGFSMIFERIWEFRDYLVLRKNIKKVRG